MPAACVRVCTLAVLACWVLAGVLWLAVLAFQGIQRRAVAWGAGRAERRAQWADADALAAISTAWRGIVKDVMACTPHYQHPQVAGVKPVAVIVGRLMVDSGCTGWDYALDATERRTLVQLAVKARTGLDVDVRSATNRDRCWSDVDLDAKAARIEQTVIKVGRDVVFSTPKTDAGTRTINLDSGIVAVLRDHKRAQAARRLLLGPGSRDHDLVFPSAEGGPMHPERTTRRFSTKADKLGLPYLSPHGLRHTWATLALRGGVNPKVVQERLGHSHVSITLAIYSQLLDDTMQAEAAENVASQVRDARRAASGDVR